MELAMTLAAVASAAVVGPALVAVAGARRATTGPDSAGGGPPHFRGDYSLAA